VFLIVVKKQSTLNLPRFHGPQWRQTVKATMFASMLQHGACSWWWW